jgi:recombination protein RecA
MGDAHMGLQPKLMSQALRKMKGPINISKTVALFINQLRQKMGVTFGSPDVTPGGKALKFYATTRVDMRRISTVKGKGDDSDPVGHRVRAKVIKNKVAPPFRIAEFEMTYSGHGVNKGLEILEVGKKCGIVDQKGTWFSYGDLRLGNGKEVAAQFLMDNSDMASEIKDKILDLKMPHRRNDDADATSTEVRDQ